ncbi:MAG TPA: oligosaccharide flippase family protein [Ferruginibacter sp.]|jgi:O-antigen/teichoic acid export membrane protein|nr:oligosaccharide flippase family protein [Ferruginibacter sp.]
MKNRFIRDISVNSFQLIINQFCGLVIFYVLSVHFSKENFGAINWALAVLLTVFSILSFGIDQVSIKKIASGNDAKQMLSVYIVHVLLAGGLFYGLLLTGYFFFNNSFHQYYLLLFLGIGKLMIFFSTPFKQLSNGLEKFKAFLYMSVCSNVIRSIALILIALVYPLNLHIVIIIFIVGDIAELICCLLITKYLVKTPLAIQWNKEIYFSLIKESMHLAGVAVFTSAIARFDWIFLGLLASNIILAEYSFAYKAFEVTTLPLLAIAPILIPRFTKLFQSSDNNADKEKDLFVLLRIEIIIACLIALILNISWVPVIDFITHEKYGAVNQYTILILSLCMPLLYINNFLWTILFAKGEFKQIFYIIAITFIINIAGDIFLIIFFKAAGAAFAYLIALFIQSVLYWRKTAMKEAGRLWANLFFIPIIAIGSGMISAFLFYNTAVILIVSLLIFMITLIVTKQIRLSDKKIFMRVTGL